MKKIILLFSLIAFSSFAFAQETYIIGSETLTLKTETEGTLDLLWNTINEQYRYFVRTEDGTITELKNTKNVNKKYQEEYKTVLSGLTAMDASKVNLTTYSLKTFIDKYNATTDANYVASNPKSNVNLRLGVFGGLTNSPFNRNINNEKTALFGAELEAVSDDLGSRHAIFLNLRHTTDNDEFQYSATQVALGYRFRIINKTNFNMYAQTKFATYTNAKTKTTVVNPADATALITIEDSSSGFDVPFIFGLGADVKLGNGYLTVVYDSLFAAFIDNEGNFPVDFAIGYKFNL